LDTLHHFRWQGSAPHLVDVSLQVFDTGGADDPTVDARLECGERWQKKRPMRSSEEPQPRAVSGRRSVEDSVDLGLGALVDADVDSSETEDGHSEAVPARGVNLHGCLPPMVGMFPNGHALNPG
jgi:hypothetical protein